MVMYVLKGYPNIFFRSDDHFDHQFLLDRGIRKFSCVDEMNETMISRHNERVRKGDLVYDLGDLYLKTTVERAREFRRRMAGQWYVFEGNHDQTAKKLAKEGAFVWFRQLESISLGKPYFEQKQLIMLCHYAMDVWKNSHHGSWHLHGHSHGMLPESWTCPHCQHVAPSHKLRFDVGVDCWDFYPVSIEEVKAKMATKIPLWQEYKASLKAMDEGRVE